MYNKKGMIIPTIGVVLVVVSVALMVFGSFAGWTFEVESMQKGGLAMSIHNQEEFWTKAFDQSAEIIARKSAYDLGKTGGIGGSSMWTISHPTMDELKDSFGNHMAGKLPQGDMNIGQIINWMWSNVSVTSYSSNCGSSQPCFYINISTIFSIKDDSLDAVATLNPHNFYSKISSNYFKLLVAGRAIMEDSQYNQYLENAGALYNAIIASGDSRFSGLEIKPPVIDGSIVEFTITEYCYPPDYYCLAPLKPSETGINDASGNPIPYDYVRLTFKYDMEQTDYTEPTYTFSLVATPGEDSLELICS